MKELKHLPIEDITDKYFLNAQKVISKYGDKTVVYAIFMNQETISACKIAIDLIKAYKKDLNLNIEVLRNYKEGAIVPKKSALFYIKGSYKDILPLETIILQKVGFPCVCAYNSYQIAQSMPDVSFIAMEARHTTGIDMQELASYGNSLGSKMAQKNGAKGFVSNSIKLTSGYYGSKEAYGSMPHNLIGYFNSTLEATKALYNTIKPKNLVSLIDYFGKEISDSLEVCRHFKDLAALGNLSLRIDTNKAKYIENLDGDKSIKIIKDHSKDVVLNEYTIGTGVSAAAIFYLREELNNAGFDKVKIVASSGFNYKKCESFSRVKAPIDSIGTGSYLPETTYETYATADVISYNGQLMVKKGRENLVEEWSTYNG